MTSASGPPGEPVGGQEGAPFEDSEPSGQSESHVDEAVGVGAEDSGATFRSKLRGYRTRRRAKKARRSKLRRRLTRSAIAVILLIVVIVGAGVGYTIYRFDQITRIPIGGLATDTGAAENILLIGSTNRCASQQIAVFRQECLNGVNGINSDVVMIVRIVPATHRLTLLSIPRDTFVPNARTGGLYNKIDAALVDGPGQLSAAISQDYGIPINHFVELNFGSFENVVNALGGIKMYFPDRLYDAENPPLDITKTGCIQLGGNEALALVRSRHLYYFTKGEKPNYVAIKAVTTPNGPYYTPSSGGSYDGSGDLGRIVRVHEFLRVLASAVSKRGIGNPLTDNALIGAIAPDLTVDSALGDSEMVHLALAVKDANFGSAPELTAPIIVDPSLYYYKGYSYGDVVLPSEPQDAQAVQQFLGYSLPGMKLSPASISVSVIDGTNSTTATAAVSASLGRLGYRMIPTSATHYVGPVSETTVLYAKGHIAQAERVEASLSGTVILGQGTPASGAEVSVIAGSDLTVAKPSSSTTKTTALLRTSVNVATASGVAASVRPSDQGASGNQNFSPPTSSSTPLASYDPRACPVSTTK